jgi:hypothetical protein
MNLRMGEMNYGVRLGTDSEQPKRACERKSFNVYMYFIFYFMFVLPIILLF